MLTTPGGSLPGVGSFQVFFKHGAWTCATCGAPNAGTGPSKKKRGGGDEHEGENDKCSRCGDPRKWTPKAAKVSSRVPKKTLVLLANDAAVEAVAKFVRGGTYRRGGKGSGGGGHAKPRPAPGSRSRKARVVMALATADSWGGQGLVVSAAMDSWLDMASDGTQATSDIDTRGKSVMQVAAMASAQAMASKNKARRNKAPCIVEESPLYEQA